MIVFLCLGLSVFATIEDHKYEVEVEDALFYLEIVVVIWFTIEFFFRYGINTVSEISELQKIVQKLSELCRLLKVMGPTYKKGLLQEPQMFACFVSLKVAWFQN